MLYLSVAGGGNLNDFSPMLELALRIALYDFVPKVLNPYVLMPSLLLERY